MASLRSMWQKLAGKTLAAHEPTSARFMATVTQIPTNTMTATKDPIPDQYQPLWQLLNQRQLIEVKVEGSSLTYQTLVLAIDVQRGLLWLDDLFPSQHVLEVGDQLTLRHHRNGEQLSFSSPILAWGNSYGATGLAILLPEQLCYTPRRQFSRALLNNDLGVKIRPIGQDISYGSVLDISGGGIRVSIPGNLLGQLRHGALMPLCELSLSDELTIRCSARVRSFRLVRTPHRQTHISMEFVDLPQERADQLQQFIHNLVYLQNNNVQERRSA
jgi:c-di-GMP-binding flagellar brake protein YcgR